MGKEQRARSYAEQVEDERKRMLEKFQKVKLRIVRLDNKVEFEGIVDNWNEDGIKVAFRVGKIITVIPMHRVISIQAELIDIDPNEEETVQ